MYEIYHIERLENAFDDIDKLILERQRQHICIYCYKDGAFTADCTMEEMIGGSISICKSLEC